DQQGKLIGERPVCKQHRSLSCQHGHAVLYLSAKLSHAKQCAYSEAHTQHKVNPLIAPHVNPFLPSAISTVFFISTDHCIGATGDVSDTKSVPPSVRMPAAVPL
ncbi:unnamed protein product, partial [Staurois parvus]